MKKNQLTTTKSTALILGKSKSLLGITKKLLQNKAVATMPKGNALAEHEGITLIGNLMWEKETQEWMDWHEAMEYAKNLKLGGYDDWRLPTIEELKEVVILCGGVAVIRGGDNNWYEIVVKNKVNKTYHSSYKEIGFLASYAYDSYSYWTSTTDVNNSDDVWIADFPEGSIYSCSKTYAGNVRCVR